MSQNEIIDFTKWEVNGKTYTFDVADADDALKLEKAVDFLKGYEGVRLKTGLQSERIRSYCDGFYKFFDIIFGEGCGEEIFEGRHNINFCHNIYVQFLAFVTEQKKGIDKGINEVTEMYGNRAARRAAQKKKNTKK